ncbi:MAG: hypothetical protein KF809_07275 [Chloroflexi bacterium]|nr:hypothetical protein [Chloroflexota bacterium]
MTRIGILSPGTSEFDSRAQRIARTLAARGDEVTIYSRLAAGLAAEEQLDGYRIVRIPLDDEALADGRSQGARRPRSLVGRVRWALSIVGYRVRALLERLPTVRRLERFPLEPIQVARRFEASVRVEPHDVWHGMWAISLPTLERVRRRHGGVTLYDPRDVYLRSRSFDAMPRWERWLMTRFERRWARQADAVIQVSEPYAEMTARDLGLGSLPIVRNTPDRWDPPVPRPDRFRETLGLTAETRIVLYQGLLIADRGIEQAMDAILEVPDAVLVLMGPDDHRGGSRRQARFRDRAARPPYAGRVHVIDPVPPGSCSAGRPRRT